jgi:aspartate/methionine/tyrosine aminotransferase
MPAHPPISDGARGVKESRIRRLTIEAIRHGATNLAQAFPDYSPPQGFVEALLSAATSNMHQYTDTWGAYETRSAVADYIHRFHPAVKPDPDDNVLITIGAMEGMNDALFVALDPGDEAIVLEPFYECFVAQILSRHGVPRYVRLKEDGVGGFTLDLNVLESAFTRRTRAVIVNSPSNPGGKVFSRHDMKAILDLCQRHQAWLISDETYEHIYFDGHRPVSAIDVDPGLNNSVLISGFGKTFSVTGWRAGYLVANEEFLRYARPPHDVNTICAVSHVQKALLSLVASPDPYFEALRQEYDRRRKLLSDGLRKHGFTVNRVEGAYYIFAKVPEWWEDTGAELNTRLTEGGFVTGVPGDVFYGPNGGSKFIRYTFCKQRSTLELALERLDGGFKLLR